MTESKIEEFTIELLKDQGFDYLFGPDISPDGFHSERSSFLAGKNIICNSRKTYYFFWEKILGENA